MKIRTKYLSVAAAVMLCGAAFAGQDDAVITFSTTADYYADGTPVKDGEFYALCWSADASFDGLTAQGAAVNAEEKVLAKIQNKVLSMPASLEGGKTQIYSFSAGNDAVYMYAEEGNPMGEFYTYMPQYTADGKVIVDENGQLLLTTDLVDTGKNMNPDWTGGVTTAFTWKGLSLSAALDIRKGGYMFSRTKNLMQFTGNGEVTLYNERRPFVIPNSVVNVGTPEAPQYVENNTPIYLNNSSYQDYYNDSGWGQGGEAYLLDKSFVKLRNITLAYQLPRAWVSKLYLSEINVSLFCNNVFTWTHKSNTSSPASQAQVAEPPQA